MKLFGEIVGIVVASALVIFLLIILYFFAKSTIDFLKDE